MSNVNRKFKLLKGGKFSTSTNIESTISADDVLIVLHECYTTNEDEDEYYKVYYFQYNNYMHIVEIDKVRFIDDNIFDKIKRFWYKHFGV